MATLFQSLLAELVTFDLEEEPWAWKNLAKGDYCVGSFGMLHYNGKIFIFAGDEMYSNRYKDTVMRYSIADDVWETLSSVQLPVESKAQAIAIDEKFAWIALNQHVVVFDMETEQLLSDPAIPNLPNSELTQLQFVPNK